MTDMQLIYDANDSFYKAFAEANVKKMETVWATQSLICCIHPGGKPLFGRKNVIASWRAILSAYDHFKISYTNERLIVEKNAALLVCTEILDSGVVFASNIYTKENEEWRLVHHHGGLSIEADTLGIPAGQENNTLH